MFREHSNFVNCVRYSPDGTKFITVSSDKKGIIYDGKTGEKMGELAGEDGHKGSIYAVSWSPDSNQVNYPLMQKFTNFPNIASRPKVNPKMGIFPNKILRCWRFLPISQRKYGKLQTVGEEQWRGRWVVWRAQAALTTCSSAVSGRTIILWLSHWAEQSACSQPATPIRCPYHFPGTWRAWAP